MPRIPRHLTFAIAVLLFAGCAQQQPVHPIGKVAVGVLHGDAQSRCSWLSNPSGDVEVQWPAEFEVRFTPRVELVRSGQVVARDGQRVATLVRGSAAATPGCPLPEGHRAVQGGPPQLNPGTPPSDDAAQ